MIETEVAIAGCRPVGALMANLLAAREIQTLVLEKDSSIYELLRAIAMDDEVMRIFQSQSLDAVYTENATPIRGMDLLRGNRAVYLNDPDGQFIEFSNEMDELGRQYPIHT